MGDFNLPQIDWDLEASHAPPHHCSHVFLEVMRDFFLTQHVRRPTRFRVGETANVLDLILTNEEGMVRALEHLPGLGNSDHSVLQFELVCFATVEPPPSHHNFTNYKLLAEVLSSHDWTSIGEKNLDDAYKLFKTRINQALKDCTKIRKNKPKRNIYMNRSAFQVKKRKNELWSQYCRSRDVLDFARFARCRNELRRMTRGLRRDHERKLAADLKRSPKGFWKYAKSRLRTRCRVEDLIDANDVVATTNLAKAEVLSSFFSSVFTDEDTLHTHFARAGQHSPSCPS